ncbi:MAG: DUF3052 domain-containing protein [Frankia sp.]
MGNNARRTTGPAGTGPTPLARKLGIRPESRLRLTGAPPGFAVAGLPPGVVVRIDPTGNPDPTRATEPTGNPEPNGNPDPTRDAESADQDGERDDVVVFFVTARADLMERCARLAAGLTTAGGLWVCWPKRAAVRAGRAATDLDDTVVRSIGLAAGLVDNKVCAVDEVWSGLRFVRRVSERSR